MRGDRRIETTHRVIWTLPSPCTWVDVTQVFVVIRQSGNGPELEKWDDSVKVEAHDDEIWIWYPTDTPSEDA